MGRTGRGRAATPRGSGVADSRALQAPQLRVVSGEFYPDWEHVYRDNVDRVYRTMFAKVGNRPDAEDLTAEVFLAVLRPLRVPASVGEVRAYLQATARTVLAGHWRRTLGLEVTTLDDEHTATAVVEHTAAAPPNRTRAILAALPANYR